jgi:hypothetical protein
LTTVEGNWRNGREAGHVNTSSISQVLLIEMPGTWVWALLLRNDTSVPTATLRRTEPWVENGLSQV